MKFSKWIKKVKAYKYKKSKNKFINKTVCTKNGDVVTIEGVAQLISHIVDMKLEDKK